MQLKTAVVALGLLASTCVAPAYAAEQQKCGDYSEIKEDLKTGYNEVTVAVGILMGGNLMEITASPSGSFTALLVRPDGTACVVGAGENFESVTPEPTGPLA